MKLRCAPFIILFALLQGCGSVMTIPHSNDKIADDLRHRKTYCDTIPRIYSGTAYNFCVLNAEPVNKQITTNFMLDLMVIDIAMSATVDTLALPVTVAQQCYNGSVQIH